MGRKPIGDRAMTAAERQQRRRERIKAAQRNYPMTDGFWLQERLFKEIETWRIVRPDLSTSQVADVVQQFVVDRLRLQAFWESVRKSASAGSEQGPN